MSDAEKRRRLAQLPMPNMFFRKPKTALIYVCSRYEDPIIEFLYNWRRVRALKDKHKISDGWLDILASKMKYLWELIFPPKCNASGTRTRSRKKAKPVIDFIPKLEQIPEIYEPEEFNEKDEDMLLLLLGSKLSKI